MSFNSWRNLGFFLMLGLFCGFASHRAEAQAKKSGSKAKIEATADKADKDGKQTITITMTIDKDWHFYANPVGVNDLVDAQTVVKITGKGKPEVLKIEYPEGTLFKDKTVGDYKVYEDKVSIKAIVKRKPGDTEKLDISVEVQACSKSTCLIPETVKLTVP